MINDLLYKVEKDIASLLLSKLEYKQITIERASEIASFVMSSLPENLTDEQLEKVIPSLDDEFVELTGLIHDYMKEFEEKKRLKLIRETEQLIKNNRLQEANTLMTNYFKKKITW